MMVPPMDLLIFAMLIAISVREPSLFIRTTKVFLAARRDGLREASGRYILSLDSDDALLEGCIKKGMRCNCLDWC